jgi:hypothetical protein
MDIVRRIIRLFGAFVISLALSKTSFAQTTPAPAGHQHEMPTQPDHEDSGMTMPGMSRAGSGTSWLSDESPLYVIHKTAGQWMLMFHENLFVQYLYESGARGVDQFGSVNWAMGMAERSFPRGTLNVRAMFSAEPLTIRGCGYPDLLASGERCDGQPIHDRQHPHDLFMELAASYDAPLVGDTRWQIYAAPSGEPALGPVAFPHRVSAMASPLAPISHHWLDATHISFGVLTGGVYSHRWKAEASVFNGREPDERRTDIEFDKLDSVSGRVWFLPTARLAIQFSMGQLTDAEEGDHGATPIDVVRTTASITYHHPLKENSTWATTVAWGNNSESDRRSNALLLETTVSIRDRDTWYGRAKVVGKNGHDLAIADSDEEFAVAKIQAGYTRYVRPIGTLQPGVGGGISFGIVPETLIDDYGRRANLGAALYFTVRPAR